MKRSRGDRNLTVTKFLGWDIPVRHHKFYSKLIF
jgi:hypothetical protein